MNHAALRALHLTTLVGLVGLVWSGIGPDDRATRALEVAPVVIVLPLLGGGAAEVFLALCGALTAQLLLGRWHDRQLAAMPVSAGPSLRAARLSSRPRRAHRSHGGRKRNGRRRAGETGIAVW